MVERRPENNAVFVPHPCPRAQLKGSVSPVDVISSKVYCIIAIMGGLIDGVVVACDEQSAKDEVRAALDYVDSYGNLDEDYVACYSFDLPCADPAPAGQWIGNWDLTSTQEEINKRFAEAGM